MAAVEEAGMSRGGGGGRGWAPRRKRRQGTGAAAAEEVEAGAQRRRRRQGKRIRRWRRQGRRGRGGRASGEDDGEASSRRCEEALGHGWKDKVGEVGWWAIWAALGLSFPFKAH